MLKSKNKPHSESYFHEERNYWYNPDFLELMAKRWELHRYESMLDVGSGKCHWSRLLAPFLKPGAEITALDSDPLWSQGSVEIARDFEDMETNVHFEKGNACALPFPDNSFDVVTCQTLLIHVDSPERALQEMQRVVKNDGIVICAEPNNRVQAVLQDSSNVGEDIDRVLDRLRMSLVAEKEKIQNREGNNSFGDLLSGTMSKLGFSEIQSYLNDKLIPVYPPYDSPEQQAAINVYLTHGKSAANKQAFDTAYRKALRKEGYLSFLKKLDDGDSVIHRKLRNQTYSYGGAAVIYLVSGKKV